MASDNGTESAGQPAQGTLDLATIVAHGMGRTQALDGSVKLHWLGIWNSVFHMKSLLHMRKACGVIFLRLEEPDED